MIDNINIKGIKSISKLSLDCTNLNILVGTNSSGKSTILQALLLLSQNVSSDNQFSLNGPLVSLGDKTDAFSSLMSGDKKIEVEITSNTDSIRYEHPYDGAGIISTAAKDSFIDSVNYKKGLCYLSCARIGAQDVYNKNNSKYFKYGISGEYSFAFLEANSSKSVDLRLIKYNADHTLLGQVNYWLKYIVNATVDISEIPHADLVQFSYSTNGQTKKRPKNVGSGISYLISIIIVGLSSPENSTIIIENPEIHLHPSAQSKLTEFLYFISQSNRQIFVETHSDHIFNGIRVGVATNTMKKEDVNVNFISFDEIKGTTATKIEIEDDGNIANPQDGLFDQFSIDLDKMLGF